MHVDSEIQNSHRGGEYRRVAPLGPTEDSGSRPSLVAAPEISLTPEPVMEQKDPPNSEATSGWKVYLSNLSIATKITSLVGYMAVGSLIVYLIVRSCVASLSTQIQDLGETQIAAVRHGMMADMMHDGLRAVALRSIVGRQNNDEETLKEAAQEVEEFIQNAQGALNGLAALPIPAEATAALEKVRPVFDDYGKNAAKIVSLSSAGKLQEAIEALPPFQEVFEELEEAMEKLGDLIQNNATDSAQRAVKNAGATSNLITMVFIALVAISLFVGWFISTSITRPLGLAVRALETNDMSALAGITSRDEIGRISIAVTNTLRKIEDDTARMNEAAQRAREMEKAAEKEAAERQRLAAEQENAARERAQTAEKERMEREREAAARQQRESSERQARAEEESRRQREAAEVERKRSDEVQRKVDEILKVVEAASAGDLTQVVNVSGTDAVGQVGIALQKLLTRLRTNIKQVASRTISVGTASKEMEEIGGSISKHADKTLNDSNSASTAADEINSNIQMVASAAEEMSASIDEVTRNATNAAKIAVAALDCAHRTSATVQELGKSSSEIGDVVKAINSIAEQTNLLALNATIEAARAGEAGKGFAVVANEVKDLSKETAAATEDISAKVMAIQATTQEAVVAIEEITKVINEISEIQTTIAAALEEQSATTRSISHNVADVATGASEVVGGVARVVETANTTAQRAEEARQSAKTLAQVAKELEAVMGQFHV